MARECKLSYRINGGTLTDISTHGFHLVKSDDRITAPIKPYEEQKYPESAAVEIYPHTVKDTFEYTVELLALGNYNTVNAAVKNFWNSFFSGTQAYPITLYNYWKGVQVIGYPKSADPVSSYPRLAEHEKSAYIFKLTLYVANPETLTIL